MNIKFVCVSKNGEEEEKQGNNYTLQVVLSEIPREIWKQYFYFKCRRSTIIRKKAINIIQDEIIVRIEKEKNIQEYIEILKQLIIEANKLVKISFIDTKKIKLLDA